MCGLAGFFDTSGLIPLPECEAIGTRMGDALRHRGPDHGATWRDPDVPLVLAHRRLSILDLSPEGNQPKASASGRFVIVFNGEIYNFIELRRSLSDRGVSFVGRGDTEVLLAAVDFWGLDETLRRINGMFAFALWDRTNRVIHFARDRLGKKPLFLGWAGPCLVFGSELRAIQAHPMFRNALDRETASLFFRLGYVPSGCSILQCVTSLLPAHVVSVPVTSITAGDGLAGLARSYWDCREVLLAAKQRPPQPCNDDRFAVEFEDLLGRCVHDRLVSDVPLGAFLSGGLDSTAVTLLMTHHSSRRIKTFTIGFGERDFDEATHARAVAKHLGTEHHELRLDPERALATIPMLAEVYDEPLADISAIPTVLLAQFSREHVTVALSGDGGDEMLGGYNRHVTGPAIWRRSRVLPGFVRTLIASLIQSVPPSAWNRLNRRRPQFGSAAHKAAAALDAADAQEFYWRLVCPWRDPPLADTDIAAPLREEVPPGLCMAEAMMFMDTVTYLPGNILTKLDRATMAASLEARCPLLDPRIYEFSWSLPVDYRIRHGCGKWVLRQMLAKHLPQELYDRPKQGFSIPVAEWLRGPLREWAESLLATSQLRDSGLDEKRVRRRWLAHVAGRGRHEQALWTVLMFQAWRQRWMAA